MRLHYIVEKPTSAPVAELVPEMIAVAWGGEQSMGIFTRFENLFCYLVIAGLSCSQTDCIRQSEEDLVHKSFIINHLL